MATQTKTKSAKARSEPAPDVRPLSDRVLVKPEEAEERTAGGIYLPDTAKEKPLQGTVVAVGPGSLGEDGERQPLSVKAGDRVIYGKYSGTEIKIGGEEYTILRELDLLGVLDG